MNRIILSLLLSTISLFANTPWPGVEYTEVRAFAWDPAKTPDFKPLINPDMGFALGVIDPKGTRLSPAQIQRLLTAETRRFKERALAMCYNPHNAFVFYNARKKPVAYLEICFDCFGARPYPRDKDCDPDFPTLAAICSELKLPFGEYKNLAGLQKDYRRISKDLTKEVAKAKAKKLRNLQLFSGKWATPDGSFIMEFLPSGIYQIITSPSDLNVHFSRIPEKLKILHLITKKGQWKISDNRLSLTILHPYPDKSVWSNFDIVQLDAQRLTIKTTGHPPMKFLRIK